jgi:hypothetical protein
LAVELVEAARDAGFAFRAVDAPSHERAAQLERGIIQPARHGGAETDDQALGDTLEREAFLDVPGEGPPRDRGGIAEAVERRAVEPRTAAAVVLIDLLRWQVPAALSGMSDQPLYLLLDRLALRLPIRRDSRVGGPRRVHQPDGGDTAAAAPAPSGSGSDGGL